MWGKGRTRLFDARSPPSNTLFFLEGHNSIVLVYCTTSKEFSIYYSVRKLVRLLLSETSWTIPLAWNVLAFIYLYNRYCTRKTFCTMGTSWHTPEQISTLLAEIFLHLYVHWYGSLRGKRLVRIPRHYYRAIMSAAPTSLRLSDSELRI